MNAPSGNNYGNRIHTFKHIYILKKVFNYLEFKRQIAVEAADFSFIVAFLFRTVPQLQKNLAEKKGRSISYLTHLFYVAFSYNSKKMSVPLLYRLTPRCHPFTEKKLELRKKEPQLDLPSRNQSM